MTDTTPTIGYLCVDRYEDESDTGFWLLRFRDAFERPLTCVVDRLEGMKGLCFPVEVEQAGMGLLVVYYAERPGGRRRRAVVRPGQLVDGGRCD